jgi:hypothetical protein
MLARLTEHAVSPRLDPSWVAVLQYANSHSLVMGRDIVFPYGPLGYLLTGMHGGGEVNQRLAFEIPFVALNSLGLVLLSRRLPQRWGPAMLGLVVFGPIQLGVVREVLVPLGLLSWGLLCFVVPNRLLAMPVLGLGLLAGVAGMAKFTWLTTGTLTVAAVLLDLALRRQWRPMLVLGAVFPMVALAGWMLHNQPLGGIVDYLAASVSVSSGYNSAMGVPCAKSILVPGIIMCGSVVTAIMMSTPLKGVTYTEQLRCGVMSLWLSGISFISWKHGFVRADLHVLFFFLFASAIPFAVLAVPAPSRGMDTVRKCCALVAVALTLIVSFRVRSEAVLNAPCVAMTNVSQNIRCLTHLRSNRDSRTSEWYAACEKMALPEIKATLGNDSVDVFGYRQAYAIANGWNYTPRPMFQSYGAFNRDLCRRNADFYRSPRAPAWVLFSLEAIDFRLPTLEDSECLAEILRNYKFVKDADSFLLLKRHTFDNPEARLLHAGNTVVGAPIDLSPYAKHDLWIEVAVTPNLSSRIQSALLRPPGLRVRVQTESMGPMPLPGASEEIVYSAPVGMLATGFIASPLLETNADVKEYLTGIASKRVHTLTFEPAVRNTTLAKASISYAIYSLGSSTVAGDSSSPSDSANNDRVVSPQASSESSTSP